MKRTQLKTLSDIGFSALTDGQSLPQLLLRGIISKPKRNPNEFNTENKILTRT